MTDVKSAKDALVASLFELSKAAQDAAGATVSFYKATSQEGNANSLNNLASTLNAIASSVGSATADNKTAVANSTNALATTDNKTATAAPAEPKKKKKVERDPNAPKKPLTIYFAFSFHTREVIKVDRKKKGLPALSAVEMNTIVRERWNSITEEEKSKWQKKYANELKEYKKVKEVYKASLVEKDVKKPESDKDSSDSESAEEEEVKVPEPSLSTENTKKKEKKRKSEKGDKEKKSDKKSKK